MGASPGAEGSLGVGPLPGWRPLSRRPDVLQPLHPPLLRCVLAPSVTSGALTTFGLLLEVFGFPAAMAPLASVSLLGSPALPSPAVSALPSLAL